MAVVFNDQIQNMKEAQPQTIYLKDYQPSPFLIDRTDLIVELGETSTSVTARLALRRNPAAENCDGTLELDGGAALQLQSIKLNGETLAEGRYSRDGEVLTVRELPDSCQLETVVTIKPQENTTLEGLYKSHTMFCTQCEAEGFRHITFYLDRPDVMSEFTTQVIGDKVTYPVLLSNGNPVARGELDGGRHFVTWHDPFKKPCYLFALVAGTLSVVEDRFTTMSGREVALQIFVEEKDLDKCEHAMRSLKASMKWDEEVYGREYDLDIFMIVAVDDFNMGAMENKGLNIFNTSAVLANPRISTDAAFQRIEGIVAHEYFHNWSGNRVTCRDWFQLSLKEGFTVYRDAQFSADMNSATVKRVEDVGILRSMQFAEDAGPMSHPVQPDSYMEINNFYTLTVYEKGAEVVGMIHTLLGDELFRKGSDLYFERHDGQAATIEDFVRAMEQVSGRDLGQFRRWYKQSGTPHLAVSSEWNQDAATLTLNVKQSCPPTPGQAEKQPFVIPVRLGLVGANGDLPLNGRGDTELVVEISEAEQSLVFENIREPAVPSLLRGFSAPVKLDYPYSSAELAHLMAADSDGFNRWDACHKLGMTVINKLIDDVLAKRELVLDSALVDAYRSLLADVSLDPAMVALMLQLPNEAELYDAAESIHPQSTYTAREFVVTQLASQLQAELQATYQRLDIREDYQPNVQQIGRRSLKNAALGYLMHLPQPPVELASQQYAQADNMTDRAAALKVLVNCPAAVEQAGAALAHFEQAYADEPLAMNLWFQMQATNRQPDGLARVESLFTHSAFAMTNPNKVRSLIGAFCMGNNNNFHARDGSGYRFLAAQIKALNGINPQIAARLVTPLSNWRRFAEPQRGHMQSALQEIVATPDLARDIFEIASKSL